MSGHVDGAWPRELRCPGCGEAFGGGRHHLTTCPIFVSLNFPKAACPCGRHSFRWPNRRWYAVPALAYFAPKGSLLDRPPNCVLEGRPLSTDPRRGAA